MWTKEDLAKFKGFQVIINKCDFALKGESLVVAANLKLWFDSLYKKIQESIDKEPKQAEQKAKK